MKDFLYVLYSYIKYRVRAIVKSLISLGIFYILFLLYSLPLEAFYYASLLVFSFLNLTGTIGFLIFYIKYNRLAKFKENISVNHISFSQSNNIVEKEYQEIIKKVLNDNLNIMIKKDEAYNNMLDYYTIWAHQIKTPIAAMRLLLQTESSDTSTDLLEQLFKIEQYVEMVLQYLRMENMSSDLLIRKYSLDHIVKQAVKKYSKLFIRKKIKLNYEDLNCDVLTDEKWLEFVIEQLLSNALKYTSTGEISIYMDPELEETLVIEDTGIGIEAENLPRIFEKGFTGFNGRLDKKSTGIGLFLCKQILNKLSHEITIMSEIDRGTKIKVNLQSVKINVDD